MTAQLKTRKDTGEMTLTACLNRILSRVKFDVFSDEVVTELKDSFDYIEKKLKICPEETAILSCILENTSGINTCSDCDIALHLGCSNIEFMSFRNHLDSLVEKRLVRIVKGKYYKQTYVAFTELCQAIIEDREYTARSYEGLDTEGVLSQMRILFKSFWANETTKELLLDDINVMMNANQQNLFCRRLLELGIKELPVLEQRLIYYLAIHYVFYDNKAVDVKNTYNLITDEEDFQIFLRRYRCENMMSQKKCFITFGGEDGFLDKTTVTLSDKIKEECFSEIELLGDMRMEERKDLLNSDNIVAKELFYNTKEQEQVNRLESLLGIEQFNAVQERLEEMGMRKGFNIILYGAPGTGKTETTMQLARKTGRDLLVIDMSKLKSKWVGDSEKAVKGVFSLYKNLCKTKTVKPILFFNEADAIFGKRIENVDSSANQMINTIQNIILQEMETIDGIMICTTNLHSNLDPAFERRFIYKIELEKPDETVRNKIWKSMMNGFNEEEYSTVSRKYPFSGGQIENIVRKSTVDYILSGKKASLETICKFCDEETFKSKVRRVGF